MLNVGAWYVDAELEQRFKLLGVGKDTVRIEYEDGTERVVNRIMFELQAKEEGT